MLKLLAFLWSGCWHKWSILKTGPVTVEGVKAGSYYELQCQRCGDVKCRSMLV